MKNESKFNMKNKETWVKFKKVFFAVFGWTSSVLSFLAGGMLLIITFTGGLGIAGSIVFGIIAVLLLVYGTVMIKTVLTESNDPIAIQRTYKKMLTEHLTVPEENTNKEAADVLSAELNPAKVAVSGSDLSKTFVYNLNDNFYENWSMLMTYYKISKQQATTAFICSIVFSILGVTLIAFAIVSPHILNLSAEYSLVPVIGSIAGAVVEVFAGTILVVYIKTLSQMSIYHTALADYQRYLSCACLVGNLTEEKRDEMYAEIIREEMKKTTFVEVQSKKTGLFGKKSTN